MTLKLALLKQLLIHLNNNIIMPNIYLLPAFLVISMLIHILIFKINNSTKDRIEDIIQHQSKEYLRVYNIVCKLIENGSDVTTLLKQCEESLTNDHFDKGWRDACLAHIKTKK